MGHVKMMAAAQPFLSGAISKTVNMPESSTVEDIEHVYYEAWKLGLKAIAIYRDNCKRSQPLATSLKQSQNDGKKSDAAIGMQLPTRALLEKGFTADEVLGAMTDPAELAALKQKLSVVTRRKLPDERAAITHKFSISGHEGYLTVGLFEDGLPGELFCTMSKEGSTISGLMDAFATSISLALQYGVPLKVLVDKFSHMRFEPSGFTGNPHVPIAKSVCDYLFRWLGLKFLPADERPFDPTAAQGEMFVQARPENATAIEPKALAAAVSPQSIFRPAPKVSGREMQEKRTFQAQADAPACPACGSITVRCGACYKCDNCGATTGCG
jgi:ribonucleoside-diphosphate reductase alpha chain